MAERDSKQVHQNTLRRSRVPPLPGIVPEVLAAAVFFGAACWLLDAVLSATLSGQALGDALLPEGEALALRSAVSFVVAVAAAITTSFVIRELRHRDDSTAMNAEPASELLENFADCAFAVNHKGEIIDANRAAARLFCWPVNMFMPMKLDWLVSEYIGEDAAHINTFEDIVEADADCCKHSSIAIIGKALSGRKFVADLRCMPSNDKERRYIVFVNERADTSAGLAERRKAS